MNAKFLGLWIALAGCTGDTDPANETDETDVTDTEDTGDTDIEDTDIEDTDVVNAELSENWALWTSTNTSTYDYVLTYGCFCPESVTGPARVFVVDNQVDHAYYTEDEQPVSDGFDAQTIDGLFQILENAYTTADVINVTYDETTGIPLQASIDYYVEADDDELNFSVDDFQTE